MAVTRRQFLMGGASGTEVMFARMSSAEAGRKFVDEVTADLQV